MRIVHVMDYFQPQIGYQETFLAREHAKMGHEVFVITSDRYDPLLYPSNRDLLGHSRIKGAGLFIEEGINVWRLKTLFELPYEIWMRGLEKKVVELEPDIVIVHRIVKLESIRIARLKQRRGSFKLIYDDHMTFRNTGSPLRILYPLFRWTFSRLIQKNADAIVAIANDTKDFMVDTYGIPPERIAVIPLGADDELFRFDRDARQQIRSELSLGESDTVFIYTGKVLPQRKLHLLIDAVRHLKSYNNLRVMLVGNGPSTHIRELKQSIADAGLEDKFTWHDFVPNSELYKYYSASDVAVWPYGASISQREAMACGLPLLLSSNLNVTELGDYNNALLFNVDDSSDLARQMERMLNPELRREMGQNSRRFVEEKLSWKIIARQFIELVV